MVEMQKAIIPKHLRGIRLISSLSEFYLVNIPSGVYYIYAKILPDQVQRIASMWGTECWVEIEDGERTRLESLGNRYTVPLRIINLTLEQTLELCPKIAGLRFSTRQLADDFLRSSK